MKTHFSIFFLTLMIALFSIYPVEGAEETGIISTQDKYVLTEYRHSDKSTIIEIELVNLKPDEVNAENPITFDIIKTDFVLTDKDKLANPNNILSSENIQIFSDLKDPDTVLDTLTITESSTKFYLSVDNIGEEIATYSGKIFLVSSKDPITINVEIKILDNDREETIVKLVQDKYSITKDVDVPFILSGGNFDLVEIELVNLKPDEVNAENPITFDIIKTDFVLTSKGKLSFADEILTKDEIKISLNKDKESIIQSEEISLSESSMKFYAIINSDKLDIATYSGKIFLISDEQIVPIDLKIEIIQNYWLLILTSSIGIISAIILVSFVASKGEAGWMDLIYKPGDSPPLFTILTAIIGLPSAFLVSTNFIENTAADIGISIGLGLLIVVKMIKRKPPTTEDDNTVEVKFNLSEDSQNKKAELLNELNENKNLSKWLSALRVVNVDYK